MNEKRKNRIVIEVAAKTMWELSKLLKESLSEMITGDEKNHSDN